MGGTIGVESEPSRGSRFWFTLPLPVASVDGGVRAISSQRVGAPPSPGTLGLNAVVIVPHAATRNEICAVLAGHGIRAFGIPDLESLPAPRTAFFRVAIVDTRLLVEHPAAVERELRKARGGVRLIAFGSAGSETRGVPGLAGRIARPIRREALVDSVRRAANSTASFALAVHKKPEYTRPTLSGRVLLAEDHVINREVAVGMLALLGCDVVTAENGREALDRFDADKLDLILMDCQMPEMDGYAASREIRYREAALGLARTPIVALTANAMFGDEEKCMAAGMDAFVSKPYTLDGLASVLARFLDEGPPSMQVEVGASAPEPLDPPELPEVDLIDSHALSDLRILDRPGKPSVVSRLLGLLADNTPATLRRMSAASEVDDWRAVAAEAHQLKSTSASLGLPGVASRNIAIEEAIRESRFDDVRRLLAELVDGFPRALSALRSAVRGNR
jgi:CheY-like chemotaxis protein/HPt (histidine-containing phosphotransfer) domain-containing protein